MKFIDYEEYRKQINSFLDQIIDKYNKKDEKAIEKLYNKIEKLENENTHFAAKYDEEIFSH